MTAHAPHLAFVEGDRHRALVVFDAGSPQQRLKQPHGKRVRLGIMMESVTC